MLILVALALTCLPATTNCQLLVANFKDNSSQPVDPDVVKVLLRSIELLKKNMDIIFKSYRKK